MKLGCDPELFIQKDGKIIPSRQIIPYHGLKVPDNVWDNKPERVFRDGIQAEIRPTPRYCRAELGVQIASCLQAIHQAAEAIQAEPRYSTSVEIALPDFEEEDLQLGCMPSYSAYRAEPMQVPEAYPIRSAGGHIHMGLLKGTFDPARLAKVCDLHLGLVGVILDRDPLAAERRKLYGRAGEYRTPPHGFEYRTLSNFWLRAYPVMSMMFQLAREAWVATRYLPTNFDFPDELETVINTNDLQGARDLWKWWSKKYVDHVAYPPYNSYPDQFNRFLESSLDDHFSKDVLKNWTTNSNDAHYSGGETFLSKL